MTPFIKYYPSIGYNTEIIHCYVASGIKKAGDLQLDHDEIMSVVKIDFKKVLKMIMSGKITDSKDNLCCLDLCCKQEISRIDWFYQISNICPTP